MRTLGALVVGGAIGGGIVWSLSPRHVVYVDRIVSAAAPRNEPPPPAVSVGVLVIPESAASAPPEAIRLPEAPSLLSRDAALGAERAILDIARTALGRGDGAHALEAVDRHTREFPRGQMAEEREAIGVQALVKLGRKDEAATRGERFRKRYPNSVLGPVIDAALEANK